VSESTDDSGGIANVPRTAREQMGEKAGQNYVAEQKKAEPKSLAGYKPSVINYVKPSPSGHGREDRSRKSPSLWKYPTTSVANSPGDADAIVTEVTMRKRSERHVDWATSVCRGEGLYSLASSHSKAIVFPS